MYNCRHDQFAMLLSTCLPRKAAIWQKAIIDKPATRSTSRKANRQISPGSGSKKEKKPAARVNANRQRQDNDTCILLRKYCTANPKLARHVQVSTLSKQRLQQTRDNSSRIGPGHLATKPIGYKRYASHLVGPSSGSAGVDLLSTLVSLSLAAEGLKVGLKAGWLVHCGGWVFWEHLHDD